ncbi:hypothetical protein Tco_1357793 [Tanacetum coccineum]
MGQQPNVPQAGSTMGFEDNPPGRGGNPAMTYQPKIAAIPMARTQPVNIVLFTSMRSIMLCLLKFNLGIGMRRGPPFKNYPMGPNSVEVHIGNADELGANKSITQKRGDAEESLISDSGMSRFDSGSVDSREGGFGGLGDPGGGGGDDMRDGGVGGKGGPRDDGFGGDDKYFEHSLRSSEEGEEVPGVGNAKDFESSSSEEDEVLGVGSAKYFESSSSEEEEVLGVGSAKYFRVLIFQRMR